MSSASVCNGTVWQQQFNALMKKNVTLKTREWRATVCEVVLPAVILITLVGLRAAVTIDSQDARTLYSSHRCVSTANRVSLCTVFSM